MESPGLGLTNEPAAIGCLILIAVTAGCSYRGFTSQAFFDRWLFRPVSILRDRQVYRLVSAGFVHADWGHLILNMFSLYLFGSELELQLGLPTLLGIYFASIVGGNLVSLYLHRHHEYEAIGASGGVCGVIFASIFLMPGGAVILLMLPIPIPCWIYAILFLAVSFVRLRRPTDHIGHDAHLGGAVVGLLVATALYPDIVTASPVLYATVMGLTVLMAAYLYKYPTHMPGPAAFTRRYWEDLFLRLRRRGETRLRADEDRTLNRLLEKISRSGLDSLTPGERRQLDDISRRKRR
jgi:membrane associated rhomboid family serine protease